MLVTRKAASHPEAARFRSRKAITKTAARKTPAARPADAEALAVVLEDFDRRLDDIDRRTDALMARSRQA